MFHGNGLVVMTVSQGQGGISREKGDKNNLGCLGRAHRAPRAQVPRCSQEWEFLSVPSFPFKNLHLFSIFIVPIANAAGFTSRTDRLPYRKSLSVFLVLKCHFSLAFRVRK